MFICEIWLFHWYFLNSAYLICRSTDISKCFRRFLRLPDNESRLFTVCVSFSPDICFHEANPFQRRKFVMAVLSIYRKVNGQMASTEFSSAIVSL